MLILAGQISGIAFIFGMDSFKSPENGSMTNPLIVMIVFTVLCLLLATQLKESPFMTDKKE